MLHCGLFTLTILLALGRAATAQTSVAVVGGSVYDQTGAVLPGATVELVTSTGSVAQTAAADAAGAFRFDHVAAGQYELRARYEGFKPASARVRVGRGSPGAQKLVLGLADLTQEVTVSNASGTVTTETSANSDAIVIDHQALDDLPIFDRDVVGAVSRFLDAGAIGTDGVTLLVDGMEARNIGVSTSAIQQIKINQDPYAAEFARPGRGRVDIITKAGTQAYRGSADFTFREARLDARDPFAATRPAGQRRIVEGVLGGPIRSGTTTSFMLTAERNEEDRQAVVYAVDPSGTIRANVLRPRRGLQLSGTINHQRGRDTTLSLRVTHENRSRRNQGVGGTVLPEAASDDRQYEAQAVYSQRTVVTPRLLHELRVLYGQQEETTVSVNRGPHIVVLDAFSGGGAQSDRQEGEHHVTFTDMLTYAAGRHVVKAGVNVPDWSRRRDDDLTNTDGTFTFSTLQDYTLGRPFSFEQQRGDGHLVFLQKVLGGFVQDQIALRPNLTVSAGLRYDWQNYFVDNNNFSPRASFAYAPGERRGTVIRGGAGIFSDRAGRGPIADLLHSRQGRLFRYLVLDPTYPDPSLGGTAQTAPPSLVRLGPGLTIPYTVQYSLGVERQLRRSTTLAINYVGTRGVNMFRSRDVNAPPPPFYLARPDPVYGVIREMESTGRQRTDSIQFTLRGRIGRVFNGSAQYTLGRARNDTNGIGSLPADNYDLSGEWGRADFDQRHRFDVFDRVSVGKLFDLGISLSLYSGRPYSLRTGRDDFNNGQSNARPAGVARNTLQGPGSAVLDLRWSRQLVAQKRTGGDDSRSITIGVDAFNVLNRVNYSNYVGNISSPFFGRATAAQPPRRLQLSLQARF